MSLRNYMTALFVSGGIAAAGGMYAHHKGMTPDIIGTVAQWGAARASSDPFAGQSCDVQAVNAFQAQKETFSGNGIANEERAQWADDIVEALQNPDHKISSDTAEKLGYFLKDGGLSPRKYADGTTLSSVDRFCLDDITKKLNGLLVDQATTTSGAYRPSGILVKPMRVDLNKA